MLWRAPSLIDIRASEGALPLRRGGKVNISRSFELIHRLVKSFLSIMCAGLRACAITDRWCNWTFGLSGSKQYWDICVHIEWQEFE